jgi:hypothetical protein
MQDLGFNQRDLGHGASETILHPAVAVVLLFTIVLMLRLPRKYAAIPFLMTAFLVPRGQEIYFLGQHWYALRILILTAFVRLFRAKFQVGGGMNTVDRIFVLWACYRVGAILLTNWPSGAGEQAAFLIQVFGGYFLLRHLIQDEEDIARAAKALAIVAAVLGLSMLDEHIRNVNIFGYLGGARLIPELRNGAIRAQATLGHSILAGSFGATVVPLFFWLWHSGRAKGLAALGIAGAILMVFSSASSTPTLALVAGVGVLFLWPVRGSMRLARWGIVLILVLFGLVMKAPVWFIIAHINVVSGSGGYDRAMLIDTFIRHLKDWWLIGTNQNGVWGYDMWDLSNQFVAEGEQGGLVTFVCFLAIISISFSKLGKMRNRVGPQAQWLPWSLGAVMIAHIFAYFGVSYWDQNQIWWFAFLAMISTATVALQNEPVKREGSQTKKIGTLEPEPAGWAWHPALQPRDAWQIEPSHQ